MHIAICGPATLSAFQHLFDEPLVSAGYPFPGTSALALHYIERGHRVTLITTATDITECERHSSPNLDLYVLPARVRARDRALDFFREERRRITEVLAEVRADVVHAHWTYEFGLAARASRTPSLVTVHDWAPAIARFNKHAYWYFRAAMQVKCLLGDGALSAPTKYIADKVKRTYKKNVVVIPNGVDLRKYGNRLDEDGVIRIGMLNVGFSKLKNVSTALKAWANVRKNFPNAVLHLAGLKYEPGGAAEMWARARNLHHGVVFDGPIDSADVPMWFSNKTIFLHSSREESFGIVLIEAMAAAVPVVAGARSGAVPDVTGGAAVLVDVSSAKEIERGVEKVLSDLTLQADLRRRGLANAMSFSNSRIGDAYLVELHRLVSTRDNNSLSPRAAAGGDLK